jgi:hypothetical protein
MFGRRDVSLAAHTASVSTSTSLRVGININVDVNVEAYPVYDIKRQTLYFPGPEGLGLEDEDVELQDQRKGELGSSVR